MTRRFSLLLMTLLISIYFTNTLGCANAAPPDLATMVEEVRPGVVRIETPEGSGSGVIVDAFDDIGMVLTNYHVVDDASVIGVEVEDSDYYKGHIEGFDADIDLALVSICCGDFLPLTFGDVSSVKPGSEVIAIGYPLGLPGEASVTRGIVSAVRSEGGYEFIQMDAPINPGNSGGPLFSPFGEVLGINTFSLTETEGLGFAISERTIQAVLPQLREQTLLANAPTTPPTPTPTLTRVPVPTATPRATPSTPGLYFDAYGNIVTPPWMASAAPSPTNSPTHTLSPTPAPTPTLEPAPIPVPVPTTTTTPTSAPLPPPTIAPTATPVVREDYFTRGSSQDDVLHAQGTPTGIRRYEASRKTVWSYDHSSVTFSLPNKRVAEWNNISDNLNVQLIPESGDSATPGSFTLGSSQDDVLHAQGTPTGIRRYEASRKTVWSYDHSSVTFSLPNKRVAEWNNISDNLNVQLIPESGDSATPGSFTLGSSQDDVLHAQGTPTGIRRYEASRKTVWSYDHSSVTFSLPNERVTEWNNISGNLKVR